MYKLDKLVDFGEELTKKEKFATLIWYIPNYFEPLEIDREVSDMDSYATINLVCTEIERGMSLNMPIAKNISDNTPPRIYQVRNRRNEFEGNQLR